MMIRRIPNIFLVLGMVTSLFTILWLVLLTAAFPGAVEAESGTGLRFKKDDGTPLAGEEVRLLCYENASDGSPQADIIVTTDANGEPVESLPANCNYVAALHQLHEQPSGKPGHGPAYWVYATSWPPGTNLPSPAITDVVISENWTIVLFNVAVSLAWEPAPGSSYLAELHQGLQEASLYLQNLTEGQMAFGPITVHTDGRNWKSADLRFLPANDYRPTAFVGGIVSGPTPFSTTGFLTETVYAPGETYLGRYWDAYDAYQPTAGSWQNPTGTRTIVHEWAHYALFLYDEYRESGGKEAYCTCDFLPEGLCTPADRQASAMAYHYEATEFWHTAVHGDGEGAVCLTTAQWLVHNNNDWQTLAIWRDIQNLPAGLSPIHVPPNLVTDSIGLANDLYGRMPGHRQYLPISIRDGAIMPPSIYEPSIEVSVTFNPHPTETLPVQVYLLEEAASVSPTRILHQGAVFGQRPLSGPLGEMTLLGVDAMARARIEVARYATEKMSGDRFIFPDPAGVDPVLYDGLPARAITDPWQISLDATYALSGSKLTSMTVVVSASQVSNHALAQLCLVDVAVGCDQGWVRPLEEDKEASIWTAVFTPSNGMTELPRYGLIRIHDPESGEIVRWFQDSGGVGPAHGDGLAPLRDGQVMVDTFEPIPKTDGCNRVIVMPSANYAALTTSLGMDPGGTIQGPIGPPLDIDILLPDVNGICSNLSGGDPVSVILTLFYSQDTIDRLGISENRLRILHFKEPDGWLPVTIVGSSQELNWLSASVGEDGIYAIVWVLP